MAAVTFSFGALSGAERIRHLSSTLKTPRGFVPPLLVFVLPIVIATAPNLLMPGDYAMLGPSIVMGVVGAVFIVVVMSLATLFARATPSVVTFAEDGIHETRGTQKLHRGWEWVIDVMSTEVATTVVCGASKTGRLGGPPRNFVIRRNVEGWPELCDLLRRHTRFNRA